VFGQVAGPEAVEPVVREAVEDGDTEDTATYSPPPTPQPSSIRGDTIGGRTVADLLLAIGRGEPAINLTSIETILPETISNKETQRLLIGEGRLAMALAWLHLHGMSDLETWTTVVESVLRPRVRGQRIEQRMGDIRNHIVCHHKKMVSGEWKPYLPVSFTAEDVALCEALAAGIVGAREGQGRRRDGSKVRDMLLAVVAESRRASEVKITHDQWIELMGWIEPGLEHENTRLGNLRKKLSRYLKAITAYGLLTCTERGSKGIPSTYAIHWDRWRPPPD
jgi:hypothetical protein